MTILVTISACKKEPINKIQYTLSCADCNITYENKDGGTEQKSSVSSSWSYSFTGESGQFVYISAQNNNQSGSVTVKIIRDGSAFKEATSSGAYVIATASGSLP